VLLLAFAWFNVVSEPNVAAVDSVPYKMNFQGQLTGSNGAIVPNGVYNMKFSLYDSTTGGSALWTSTRLVSAGTAIQVTNGRFTVQLGRIVVLDPSLFNTSSNNLYLEVELPSPASATSTSPVWDEGPMTPRNQVLSSAYSFNADKLDGLDSTDFAQLGSSNVFSGMQSFDGSSVSIGGVSNASKFNVSSIFNVDSMDSVVSIGSSDATGTLLVLDTKTGAGEPVGADGAMYYSQSAAKFRCYQDGEWTDCITTQATLQDAYDNSNSPASITTTAGKGLRLSAGSAPTTSILDISNVGQAVSTDNANGAQISYEGGNGLIEAAGMRIDYTPGFTTGSTWDGVRIVAGDSAAGVNSNGLKIEGPSSGAGTDIGVKVATGFDIGLDVASGGLQLADQPDPTAPASGNLRIYAKSVSGRMLVKARGPSGLDYPLQPSLFQNQICMISAGTGTAMYSFGCGQTYTGTRSHPQNTQDNGYMTNFATAATAGSEAGFVTSVEQFFRGSQNGSNGFFFNARLFTIDDTDIREYVGLSSQNNIANAFASDDVSGSRVGFTFSTIRGDSNWQFTTKDNSVQDLIDTGIAYAANKVYDVYFFTPPYPNNGTIFWRIDNVTDNVTQEGSSSTRLPEPSTSMRAVVGVESQSAVAKNIRIQRMYVETDR